MQKKKLSDWLIHIESFHASEIELGLDRIRLVATQLQLEQHSGQIVIVGGTNGKGSCTAMFETAALTNGLTVGCYTSPHLLNFNERIRVSGRDVSDEELEQAFETIDEARNNIALTFFEFTTLAALWIFKQFQLDLIILEVGLGGRLDAVNIVEPDVSVITTIDYDHSDWLGHTIEAIAYEKSGITRAEKPTFVGDRRSLELLQNVETTANVLLNLVSLPARCIKTVIDDPRINQYRLKEQNLMLAIDVLKYLFKDKVWDFESALRRLHIKGRFQLLKSQPAVIVDVAHNPQAAQNLLRLLSDYCTRHEIDEVIAVCGMMADKSIEEVLAIMDERVNRWMFVDLDIARAIKAKDLQARYVNVNQEKASHVFGSVEQAFEHACTDNRKSRLILVFGSFITVANMLQYVEKV